VGRFCPGALTVTNRLRERASDNLQLINVSVSNYAPSRQPNMTTSWASGREEAMGGAFAYARKPDTRSVSGMGRRPADMASPSSSSADE